MIRGVVSNSWQAQLDQGEDLLTLIEQAVADGARAIELRQGSVGRFERSATGFATAALSELPGRFPEVRFNIAVPRPFLSPELTAPLLAPDVRAAVAVAGRFSPHLRLVDLTTPATTLRKEHVEPLAARLAQVVSEIGRSASDIILSLENAREPWHHLLASFRTARTLLGADAGRLRLCHDPCNLRNAPDDPNPGLAIRSFAADELSMIHLRQHRSGQVLPMIADGVLDWADQLAALADIGFAGLALLEMAPHPDHRRYARESWRFLDRLDR